MLLKLNNNSKIIDKLKCDLKIKAHNATATLKDEWTCPKFLL